MNNTCFFVTDNMKVYSGVSNGKKWLAKVNNWHVCKTFELRYKENCSKLRSWKAIETSVPVIVVLSSITRGTCGLSSKVPKFHA